jgi:MFS family permease
MALGPLLGGFFIALWGERDGVRLAFGAALVMAVVALILQQRMIAERPKPASPQSDACQLTPEKNPLKLFRLMNPSLKRLLVTDILIRFCEQIPYAFVVVWCMKTIAAPVTAVQFGLLTTVEMATAVLVYIPVAYMADRSTKKPFVLITFVFFTLFPLMLLFSHSLTWLVAAFVLRGLKEFGEPTRKSLILDLSPESCKAGMFGLYYLIRDVIVALAALGGALLWQISPQANLITAFGFGVVGTVGFALFGRDIQLPVGRRKTGKGAQHMKIVMVVNNELPVGLVANTAAVLGISLGHGNREIIGPDVRDATAIRHRGITKATVPILGTDGKELQSIYRKCLAGGKVDVIDFNRIAQGCRNYDDYASKLADTKNERLEFSGLCLHGPKKEIDRLTGSLGLYR